MTYMILYIYMQNKPRSKNMYRIKSKCGTIIQYDNQVNVLKHTIYGTESRKDTHQILDSSYIKRGEEASVKMVA